MEILEMVFTMVITIVSLGVGCIGVGIALAFGVKTLISGDIKELKTNLSEHQKKEDNNSIAIAKLDIQIEKNRLESNNKLDKLLENQNK